MLTATDKLKLDDAYSAYLRNANARYIDLQHACETGYTEFNRLIAKLGLSKDEAIEIAMDTHWNREEVLLSAYDNEGFSAEYLNDDVIKHIRRIVLRKNRIFAIINQRAANIELAIELIKRCSRGFANV